MNDRFLARALLQRALASGEFLILLTAIVVAAVAAGVSSTAAAVAADPVAARLLKNAPTLVFAGLVIGCPLAILRLAAADRTAGWTAPVFAGGGSAATYTMALTTSVSLAAGLLLAACSLGFNVAAGTLRMTAVARMLTGALSLAILCMYAALLWLILYDRARTLVAMLVLWLGPLAIGGYLVITKGWVDQPLWLRILLWLVPPVRLSAAFAPAVVQAAYIALLAALLIALSPKRLPLWR